ncbi:hypothetical protein C8F01DRAFT_1251900 [Mycena amicta]|nr:hypothetical protein C8F01DRAFT_1251900 [Mycena amicta]
MAFLKAAGTLLVLVFALPVLLIDKLLTPPRQDPEPLPKKRKDIIQSRRQATQPASCAFMYDLPLELRRFIYREALGGRYNLCAAVLIGGRSGHRQPLVKWESDVKGERYVALCELTIVFQWRRRTALCS